MKFEKAVVNRIEIDEEDIITTSGGCSDHTQQKMDKKIDKINNCPNETQKSGNINCPGAGVSIGWG